MVRNGTTKFETSWEPFDGPGTLIAGVLGLLGTMLATTAIDLCVVSIAGEIQPRRAVSAHASGDTAIAGTR